MKFKEELIKALTVYFLLTIVCCLVEMFLRPNWTWDMVKEWVVINALFTFPFYLSNGYLNEYLNEKLPWLENPKKRILLGTPIIILLNLVIIYGVGTLMVVYVFGGSADYMFTSNGRSMAMTSLVIVVVVTLIFHSIGFFKQNKEANILNERLRKEKISAELNVLKAQVDPHFLFNSFNVLSGLIDESPPEAQKFLSGLSKIYRYVLEHRDADLMPVSEELKFAKQYIDLQQARFENGIVLNTQVSEASLTKKIPSLSLQMILENAIKHNGFTHEQPLVIEMISENGHLLIKNNKQERRKLVESSGIGLDNIQQRYELHNVEEFSFSDEPDYFTVKLPLIT